MFECGVALWGAVPGEGDVRLAESVVAADGSAEYGRLEVFHNGGWGTVCDNGFLRTTRRTPAFSSGSVAVACGQMGYQRGFQIQALVCVLELIYTIKRDLEPLQ